MKKRLRKKLHVGEFQEMGFEVRFTLARRLTEPELDGFWDAFIDAIEGKGLACGGAVGPRWDLFVVRAGRASATEEDRQAVMSWLGSHREVSEPYVGQLVDAWYSV